MEPLTIISSIVTAIGGWEAVKYFINLKAEKRKSEAEADSAATSVIKEMQDACHIFISDAKEKMEDDRKYIATLKEDRRQLLDEREELRKRIDETEEIVRNLQREVARNGRMVESLRPFICGLLGCKRRQPVAISAEGEVSDTEPKDIEPAEMERP
jgi:septal ring factor EnvC (AmiA/AmiB activator)